MAKSASKGTKIIARGVLTSELAKVIHKERNPFIKWEDLGTGKQLNYLQHAKEILRWISEAGYEVIPNTGAGIMEGIAKGLKDEDPGD
jgi:predicted Rossmann-fold nucleotide-binding protein